jgi:hypothetical protein
MAKLVDLNEVRRAWDKRYGPVWTRAAMGSAWPGSGMAHDAMPQRRARDQDPPDDTSGQGSASLEQVKTFLQNRLSPADWQRLQQMMKALNGEEPDDEPADPSAWESIQGKDDPPSFEGAPKKGGLEHAQDASPRGNGYFDMFPANKKVGFGY